VFWVFVFALYGPMQPCKVVFEFGSVLERALSPYRSGLRLRLDLSGIDYNHCA